MFGNYVKEKYIEDISQEILVCSAEVEPLIIGIGKMVDLERFSTMDRLLKVRSYALEFVHNIKLKIIKNLKLQTGYWTSE